MTRSAAAAGLAVVLALFAGGAASAQDALGTGNALGNDLYGRGSAATGGASGRVNTRANTNYLGSVRTGGGYQPFSGSTPMGDGRALDRNLSLSTNYNSPSGSLGELRFRSAVVTGNAPGGLSFREDLGYSADRAFRGDLGSNDLFAFRRDSLYSGLVGGGLRGTDALQYQFALTTGGALPPDLVGDLVVSQAFETSRPQMRATGPDESVRPSRVPGEAAPVAPAPRPSGQDSFGEGSMLAMLRSTAAYETGMSLQPVLLSRVETEGGDDDLGLTASTLRGIKLSTLPKDEEGPTTRVDMSAAPDRDMQGLGRIETGYDAVIRQFEEAENARREAIDEAQRSGDQTWSDRIQDLRDSLDPGKINQEPTPGQGGATPDSTPESTPGINPDINPDALPGGIPGISDGVPSADDDELPPDLARLKELGVYDQDTIDLLLSARDPVSRLVEPVDDEIRNPYAEHMAFGQRLLAQERFFDAEERFTRALAIRSGDVMAQVGRVHAQIGAGMYLSGALNLRVLLIQHPELIAVRYDPKLLPDTARQEAIFERLRAKVGIGEGGRPVPTHDPQLKREAGLLLAYFGYQVGDKAAVRQGLDAVRSTPEADSQSPTAVANRRLLQLAEKIWTHQDEGEPSE